MDEYHKHVFQRLDNLEAELSELREATWPVCQGLKDQRSQFSNMKEKRRFFKFLHPQDIWTLVKTKARYLQMSRASAVEEYRLVQGAAPPLGEELV